MTINLSIQPEFEVFATLVCLSVCQVLLDLYKIGQGLRGAVIHTFSWQEKGRWVKPEPQFPCEVASGRESSVNLQNQTTCCETFYGRGSAELALNFSQSDRKHWKEPKQVNRQVKNCHRQLQPGTSGNSSPWTGPCLYRWSLFNDIIWPIIWLLWGYCSNHEVWVKVEDFIWMWLSAN